MITDIYKDGLSFLTDEVSTIPIDESNKSELNRMKFVTDLAAISRGKSESKNPAIRFKALLKEAAGNGMVKKPAPSRPLEFCPVYFKIDLMYPALYSSKNKKFYTFTKIENFYSLLQHSYLVANGKYTDCYTNMRALLNAGVPYSKIPYNSKEELKYFKAFRAKVPMFVFNHFITHTMLSKEARSERVVSLKGLDYWLPSDLLEKVDILLQKPINNAKNITTAIKTIQINQKHDEIVAYLLTLSQNLVQDVFQHLGYKKEIYQRAMLEFRYKEVVFTGWSNDPKTFQHFMLEREAYPELHKSWVQKETKQFAEALSTFFKG